MDLEPTPTLAPARRSHRATGKTAKMRKPDGLARPAAPAATPAAGTKLRWFERPGIIKSQRVLDFLRCVEAAPIERDGPGDGELPS